MRCKRVSKVQIAPDAVEWAGSAHESIEMTATPLAMQSTDYIQNSWAEKAYGRISPLDVSALHDGAMLAVRISWTAVGGTNKDFPDAVACAIPVVGDPALVLMGTPEAPIHILHWQASRDGKESLRSVLASGIGSSRPGPDIKRQVAVRRNGNHLDVVIARGLEIDGEAAPVKAGGSVNIGFAVWDGGNEERAGIKAISVDWMKLALDA